MTKIPDQLLVTTALPYANAPLHLGHILEHIQSDIWVRAQRLQGKTCHFVCGEDCHGTPVMLAAEKLGKKPEAMVAELQAIHAAELKDFLVEYDNFYTTHSDENRELASEIYLKLEANGDIEKREISQAFDPVKNIFLPDRYVKGTCPKCNAQDQYGDSCEVCGAHYSPTELKNPTSVVSGATPIEKDSVHYFFKLDKYQDMLKDWVNSGTLQPEITNKLQEWLSDDLKHWDISRDGPYFGFEIPNAPNKFFYVWLDAPMGYLASFKNYCKANNIDFNEFLDKSNEQTNKTGMYHFIGKDITYFHTLFWPAILNGAGMRRPSNVFVHGFLTVNGEKMSKSRGTFIKARKYLEHLHPEYLRYYFAAKLGPNVDDIDFNFEDFINRVNADLVGKFVNIASRASGFIFKNFAAKTSTNVINQELYNTVVGKKDLIINLFESREYAKAIREIMHLADLANKYIDEKKPWILIKDKSEAAQIEAHEVCSLMLNIFKTLMTYLSPVLPELAKKSAEFLNTNLNWDNVDKPLVNHTINKFKPLINRIDEKEVTKMQEESVTPESNAPAEADNAELETNLTKDPIAETITIDDFVKIDLRIAKIVNAEHVEEAKKLLKLTLDLGGQSRQVFAGIKSAYNPEDLIGKHTAMVANLAPRKMRFGVSEGMVLAAGPGGKDLWILEPHEGAEPGMRIK